MKKSQTIYHWKGLDLLKSICVAGILFVHAHFLLISQNYRIYAPDAYLVNTTREWMLIGVFLTLLPIAAGCVLRLNLSSNPRIGSFDSLQFLKNVSGTSLLIASVGFVMNAATWGLENTFSWNMLQMVAVGYLVTALVYSRFSLPGLIVLVLSVLLIAEPLTQWAGYYRNYYFVAIWVGNNSESILWPILPWIALPACGFIFADSYLRFGHQLKTKVIVLFIGIAMLLLSIVRDELVPDLVDRYVWAHLSNQPALGEVVGALGLFLVMFVLCEYIAIHIKFTRYGVVNSYSKGILWIYVMQMFVSYTLAPWVVAGFDIPSRLEMNTFMDLMAYAFLPCVMLILGWIMGAILIRVFDDMRFRITLKKVR